jgi:uncharacterized protein YegP (UPF0339 family)
MVFVLYRDAKNEYRWRLFGDNNSDILADSGEGYVNKSDALHGISRVRLSSAARLVDQT